MLFRNYLKKFCSINQDCLMIDFNVGIGISFDQWNGTTTILSFFLRIIWLQVCLFFVNHFDSSIDKTSFDFKGLSIF